MKKIIGFVIGFPVLFMAWTWFYDSFLAPAGWLDTFLIRLLAEPSTLIIKLLGEQAKFVSYTSVIWIDEKPILLVGAPCDGQDLFALYFCLGITYPVFSLGYRLRAIVIGWIVIHLTNVLRVVVLAFNYIYHPVSFDFNHYHIFHFIVYVVIFWLWLFSFFEAQRFYFQAISSKSKIYLVIRHAGIFALLIPLMITWQDKTWFSNWSAQQLANIGLSNWAWADTLLYSLLHLCNIGLMLLLFVWDQRKGLFRQIAIGLAVWWAVVFGTVFLYKLLKNNLLHTISEELVYFYFTPFGWVIAMLGVLWIQKTEVQKA